MTERLPPCDTWHPETPPRISQHLSGRGRKPRTVCLECQRIKTAETRHAISQRKPYGVIALKWSPPSMVSRETPDRQINNGVQHVEVRHSIDARKVHDDKNHEGRWW